jgi:Uma2 family endonuclease
VEVVSPSDSTAELSQKLREYFAIGVRLVWVADLDARAVLAYRSLNVRECRQNDRLTGDDVLPGREVPVPSRPHDPYAPCPVSSPTSSEPSVSSPAGRVVA